MVSLSAPESTSTKLSSNHFPLAQWTRRLLEAFGEARSKSNRGRGRQECVPRRLLHSFVSQWQCQAREYPGRVRTSSSNKLTTLRGHAGTRYVARSSRAVHTPQQRKRRFHHAVSVYFWILSAHSQRDVYETYTKTRNTATRKTRSVGRSVGRAPAPSQHGADLFSYVFDKRFSVTLRLS